MERGLKKIRSSVNTNQLNSLKKEMILLKQKIRVMEEEIDAVSNDIHEVRPEYVEKIKKIIAEGKFHSYNNMRELRKDIETD
ncbi:Uncharacterised protein [uncultured archaeon]|nr:Uncharacterised protein [uncultured archaeon]